MQSQTVCFVIISFFEMTTGLHQMNFLKKDIVNPFAKQERGVGVLLENYNSESAMTVVQFFGQLLGFESI